MTDTNVTIAAKRGCSDTGITEELATKLYTRARGHKDTELYAIVRFTGSTTTEDVSGASRSLNLSIAEIEPVVDGNLNGGQVLERVRELHRALSANRNRINTAGDQALPIEDSNEPTVQGVLGATSALIETDADGKVTGLWDGDPDSDEPAPEDDETAADPDDPAYDAHLFTGDGDVCEYEGCGQPRTAAVHAEVPVPS